MERIVQLLQTDPTMNLMAMEFGIAGVLSACLGLVWLRFSQAMSR